jgi:hypothetical protein
MKKVNRLSEIQNKYPEDRPLSKNYIGGVITGIYPQNKIRLQEQNFSDIIGIDGNFKVVFVIDGQKYASNSLLDELKKTDNPYINQSNIAMVELSIDDLKSDTDFSDAENYAEVDITSTIDTIEKISEHIAWLLGSDEKEIRKVDEYGSYSLRTTEYQIEEKTGLGFEFSDKVENVGG